MSCEAGEQGKDGPSLGEGQGRHQGGWDEEHLLKAEDLLQDEDLEVGEDLLLPEDGPPQTQITSKEKISISTPPLVEDPDLLLEDVYEDLQDFHRVEDLFLLHVVVEILHHQAQIVPVKLPK